VSRDPIQYPEVGQFGFVGLAILPAAGFSAGSGRLKGGLRPRLAAPQAPRWPGGSALARLRQFERERGLGSSRKSVEPDEPKQPAGEGESHGRSD
jgi:hypothetical protein